MNQANQHYLTNQHYEALLELSDIAGSYANNNSISQPDGLLRRMVERANQCLNATGRVGEVSLFFRDPFKDRLTLVASTVEEQNPNRAPGDHFETYGEQYDPADKVYYYELYDKLLPPGSDRFNRDFRKKRGTTGWVVLTGCSLRLIGKQSDDVIRAQFPSDGTFQCLLRQYGLPESGRDFSKISKTQYLGTPVVSAAGSHAVFGVLRYTAKLAQPLLDNCDLEFLKRVASQIAKLIYNLNSLKQQSRKLQFPHALDELRRTGNYENFLQFIAEALSSRIASLSVAFRIGNERVLRLVDAYGISDSVANLRCAGKLSDYSEEYPGVTWNLLNSTSNRLRLLDVKDDSGWKGRNTLAFYKEAFQLRGIDLTQNKDAKELERIVRSYSIKLIGGRLKAKGNSLASGVLKVEFPMSYNGEEWYGEEDCRFLEECRDMLVEEMTLLSAFLDCDWFASSLERSSGEFVRLLTTVVTLNLVTKAEKPEFWHCVTHFIKTRPVIKPLLGESVRNRLQVMEATNGELQKWGKRILEWLPEDVLKVIVEEGVKTVMHSF